MTAISWRDFRKKAALNPAKILLADGLDPRVVQAAVQARRERTAEPLLVGTPEAVQPLWRKHGGEDPAPCVCWEHLPKTEAAQFEEWARQLHKFKTLNAADVRERLNDPLFFGCLAVKRGLAEGFVGGATRSTADTLRAIFSVIDLAPKTSTLFGFFLMEKREPAQDSSTLILFADCAVVPDPSPKQLAHIGLGAAAAYEFFMEEKPRVVFLSFSTMGSAQHERVDAVRQAVRLAREKAPALTIEGEWQADAALDRFAADIKGVGRSPLAGRANVLIAPNLESGNIAYKLAQRLGGGRAVGPVLWGTAMPANDLSRGCSSEDVLDMIALTGLQAQAAKTVPLFSHTGKEA